MASPNYGIGGQANTFALDFEASGNLQVEFSRNPKKFKLLKWTETRPVTRPAGYFLRIDPSMAMRVQYTDGRDAAWGDRQDRPNMNNELPFEAVQFLTQRFNWGDKIGRIALDSAEFLYKEITEANLQQRCLTLRTLQAITLLNTASWGSNSGFVDGTYGGTPGVGVTLTAGQNWGNGDNTKPNIQTTIQAAIQQIVLSTGGVVQPDDLVLVIGPSTASVMAGSTEIRSTFIQSQYAMDLAKGELNPVYSYGLPSSYAGVRIEVEGTPYNSAADGLAATPGFAVAKGDAYLVCRPEGKSIVLGPDGKPYDYTSEENSRSRIISTVACMVYQDMAVKTRDNDWDERIDVAVSTNHQYVLTSPLSGFYLKKVCG